MIQTNLHNNSFLKLKENFIILLKNYLSQQKLPIEIINQIQNRDFIDYNPIFYTYYPYLFNEAFSIKKKEVLDSLSLAGFLYYKALITIDNLFDKKSSSNSFQRYLIANICQEEAIKVLSSLFPKNSPFWDTWNLRKVEYMKAYQMDKGFHKITSYKEYESLADYKSAFGKIAIDSLYFLSGETHKEAYQKILKSHKYYYTAFQILDDIRDFQEDFENNQFNLALFELQQQVSKKEINNTPLRNLKQKIYQEGIVNKLQEKALEYINKSSLVKNSLFLNQWNFEIQTLHNDIVSHKLIVKGFIKEFTSLNKLSTTKNKNKNNINNAITLGENFILNSQNKDGSWEDYLNITAGTSNTWTTAFILNYISDNFKKNNKEKIILAAQFLKKASISSNLWGYNNKWIADADSTTFTFLALIKSGETFTSKELSNWYTYQNNDGGFTTYNNEEEVIISLRNIVEDAKGWTSSHFCVSATAYYFLSKEKIVNQQYSLLRKYLIEQLSTPENCYSYWWTDIIYTLSFLIKGSEIIDDFEIKKLTYDLLEKYLMSNKIEKFISDENTFYLGLLLDCICSSDFLYKVHQESAKKISSFLISNQMTDGSWLPSYALRIPQTKLRNPNSSDISWRRSNKGTNIVLDNFNRQFTSIVCLSGLTHFYNKTS